MQLAVEDEDLELELLKSHQLKSFVTVADGTGSGFLTRDPT